MPNRSASTAPAWEALQLQLVVFPIEPAASLAEGKWRELTGLEPKEKKVQSRTSVQESGFHEDRHIVMNADISRLIWAIVPSIKLQEAPTKIPTVGMLGESLDWLRTHMGRWFTNGHCPPIKRIGVSANLILQARSREDSYGMLAAFLPGFGITATDSDFHYRVNRKTTATASPGLIVNRLLSWSSMLFFTSLSEDTAPNTAESPILETESHGCNLALDINTDSNRNSAIERSQLPALFSELCDQVKTIADNGGAA